MTMKPKFEDCIRCVHFQSWRCVRCKVGEYFEPEPDEDGVDELDEVDLVSMLTDWSDNDER